MAFDDLDQAEQAEQAEQEEQIEQIEQAESDTSDTRDETEDLDGPDASDAGPMSTDVDADTTPRTGDPDSDRTDGSATGTPGGDEDDTAVTSKPAFGFEKAKQRPLYARQGAWDVFEDALAIDVEPTLRRHDVRDASKRELHDAALRVLADHAEEVADKVLEARGVRSDTDEG
ncbi:hypothetical protein GRX01_04750 [Halobaculum sp. WSA2]|uniref:Uncharacterized protein n=1 Tax=Halobaculum saliterrae TaxID=2073113 RepID=A0A6B0SQA9_9EURY|nr:hypothetical protein [Halobaculum saliterrae]MXR40657.1 hypothetical protein [Halobaculum saliterrae]